LSLFLATYDSNDNIYKQKELDMKISKHTSIFVSVLLLAGLFSNAFAQDAMVEEKASVPMAY